MAALRERLHRLTLPHRLSLQTCQRKQSASTFACFLGECFPRPSTFDYQMTILWGKTLRTETKSTIKVKNRSTPVFGKKKKKRATIQQLKYFSTAVNGSFTQKGAERSLDGPEDVDIVGFCMRRDRVSIRPVYSHERPQSEAQLFWSQSYQVCWIMICLMEKQGDQKCVLHNHVIYKK